MATVNIFDMADTWNNVATTYTAIKMNVTDTASASGSLLMDLQVGGSSKFTVEKNGTISVGPGAIGRPAVRIAGPTENTGWFNLGSGQIWQLSTGNIVNRWNGAQLEIVSSGSIAFSTTAVSSGIDTILTRRAAANLRLGAADAASPVAQTLSVQSGTAGASALSCSISGTTLTIGGAITGTIAVGHAVTGTGVTAGTTIVSGSGTTWTVSASQTVSSTTMYFNSVGRDLTITGSQGSGPSAGGSIIFQVAPAGSSGTTAQNALATALTIGSDRSVAFAVGNCSFGAGTTSNYLRFTQSTPVFELTQGEISLVGNAIIAWGNQSNTFSGSTQDLIIRRDAANTLALRNGTNAQAFNVYKAYTSGTDYSRVALFATGGGNFALLSQVGTGGSSVGGNFYIGTTTAHAINFSTNNTDRWSISGSGGHFLAVADNTYDIGASGATRPRDLYLAGTLFVGSAGARVSSAGANVITLATSAGTAMIVASAATSQINLADYRVTFGGTTSSFPALKRSTTSLQARLADDSGFTNIQGKLTTETAYTAGAPTATGYIVIYDSTGTAYKVPAEAL